MDVKFEIKVRKNTIEIDDAETQVEKRMAMQVELQKWS